MTGHSRTAGIRHVVPDLDDDYRRRKGRPRNTGDVRRWPDSIKWVNEESERHEAAMPGWWSPRKTYELIAAAAGLTDPDLVAVIPATHYSLYNVEQEWTFANALDAAIDEQDRRNGRPVTPANRP